MASNNNNEKPVLITAVGGRIGGVSTYLVELLRKKGIKVRALMRREGEYAETMRKLGAEVIIGLDLSKLEDVHTAIKGCSKVYYSMSVKSAYLEISLMFIAVSKHYGVELFVNMSQLTATLMSVEKFLTPSPQASAHFLAEQALEWSGVPYIDVQPTIFLENPLFLHYAVDSLKSKNELRIPLGPGKQTRTNPIAAFDVARVLAHIIEYPNEYLSQHLVLLGAKLQTLDEVANEYSIGLGRPIKYVDVDLDDYRKNEMQKQIDAGLGDEHMAKHLYELAKILQEKSYEIHNDEVERITGQPPMTVRDWILEHVSDFTNNHEKSSGQAH